MVVINFALTSPVNPPNASPVLTAQQVWAALQHSIREPQDFIPAIGECKVVEEDGAVITREVQFKSGMGPPGSVREVCTSYENSRIEYLLPNGSLISTIISTGTGSETDLYITFSFSWQHQEAAAGSEKAKELEAGHRKVAQGAVKTSIEAAREMAKNGKI